MTHRVRLTHLMNLRVMTDSSINPCDVEKASLMPHLALLNPLFFLSSFLPFCFSFCLFFGVLTIVVCFPVACDECSDSV